MSASGPDILLIGFGNPGRLDDGLGPALAEAVETLDLGGVTVEADYQLTVEDAAEVAGHEVVIFADADVGGAEPFWVKRITPAESRLGFSSHGVRPAEVLALARDLFNAEPIGYILGIRGYEFDEFGEAISAKARENLAAAAAYVESAVREGFWEHFREIRNSGGNEKSFAAG